MSSGASYRGPTGAFNVRLGSGRSAAFRGLGGGGVLSQPSLAEEIQSMRDAMVNGRLVVAGPVSPERAFCPYRRGVVLAPPSKPTPPYSPRGGLCCSKISLDKFICVRRLSWRKPDRFPRLRSSVHACPGGQVLENLSGFHCIAVAKRSGRDRPRACRDHCV
jgi:hypothetical protein